jgi:transposase
LAAARADDDKARALRAAGALNPQAAAVTDPVFQGHPFFDPRDLVQVKYEMLRRVQVDGQSVTQTTARFGFSRPVFYAAQAALEQGGLPALVPQRPGPRRRHKVRPEILRFLQEVRMAEPRARLSELVERVEQRFGVRLHPRTIERVLGPRPKNAAIRRRAPRGPPARPS